MKTLASLFLTTRKMAQMLQSDGPQKCIREMGKKIYRPCMALMSSDKEESALRRLAIEAIAHAKLPSKADLRWSLISLPKELRTHFFKTAFCATATREIKIKLLQVFSSFVLGGQDISNETLKPLRDDLRAWLDSNSDASVNDFLVRCLEEPQLDEDEDAKAECVPLIVSKLGPAAIPILIDALRRSDLGHSCILTNRILSGLNTLSKAIENSIDKWQEPLELALVEKVEEIGSRLDDPYAIEIRALLRLHYRDRFDSHLDPEDRICRMLGRIGGKKALMAIYRVLNKAPESKPDQRLAGISLDTLKAIEKRHTQDYAIVFLHLTNAATSIYKRLKASGEITSTKDVPLLHEFMQKHRPREQDA